MKTLRDVEQKPITTLPVAFLEAFVSLYDVDASAYLGLKVPTIWCGRLDTIHNSIIRGFQPVKTKCRIGQQGRKRCTP